MRPNKLSIFHAGLTGLALFGLALGAHAQNAVGQVTSARGKVTANGPNGVRSIGCGDSVYAGETLSTGSRSNVGLLMGDVLTQVDARSAVRVGSTADGAPDATLTRGRVRMIDVRDGGSPGSLIAGNTRSLISGNDAEAYMLSEKVGDYAMFCEWEEPLAVARNGQRVVADPGDCVISKPREPLYTSRAHSQRITAMPADACPPDLGGLASTDPHFSPASTRGVGAGFSANLWSNLADPLGRVELNPCDVPGAVCAQAPPPPPPPPMPPMNGGCD